MRGSQSHIDAKYTFSGKVEIYQTEVTSVLVACRSLVLTSMKMILVTCSALLIKYFGIWSSVYLQLLQYFILFLLPLQRETTGHI